MYNSRWVETTMFCWYKHIVALEHKWHRRTNPFQHKLCNIYVNGLVLRHLCIKGQIILLHLCSNPLWSPPPSIMWLLYTAATKSMLCMQPSHWSCHGTYSGLEIPLFDGKTVIWQYAVFMHSPTHHWLLSSQSKPECQGSH